jgi:dTDP-4-amino-4,6-dideoxygalactose transaminase
MNVPLVDLGAQYERYRDELDAAVRRCVAGTSFVGGADHKAFAAEFAEFCGGGGAALCGNGTDALYLALLELLGQGDGEAEIITVSHTFIATVEPITLAGYRPVFVDVEEDTCLMDVDAIEAAITPLTRAIVPVHLYGQMVAMDRVREIADRHGLRVIEDAAQAHGASWKGGGPGRWGDAACFSFYPGKNLGAWGDGGAVFCRDPDRAAHIQMRANHGRQSKYEHEFVGVNSRLDGLQAAVLRVKLRHLGEWNDERRERAAIYDQLLSDVDGVQLPVTAEGATHVYHLYAVQVREHRDRVLERMKEQGVGAGIHYPIPVHEQPAYRHLGVAPDALPLTHRVAGQVLSLPLYPELTADQCRLVATALREAVGG